MKLHGDFRTPLHAATYWAVYLGCTTTRRLAFEMNIPYHTANCRLVRAAKRGFITKIRPARYEAKV